MKNVGIGLPLLLFLWLTSCTSTVRESPPQALPKFSRAEISFATGMDRIAEVIVVSFMNKYGWKRAAIGDFKANAGADTAFEKSIADGIAKSIVSMKEVSVVEKNHNDQALKELETTLYDIVHPTSERMFSVKGDLLKKYGTLTFADVIIGGTFSVRAEKIFITAYFVETETGKIHKQDFDGILKY